MSSASCSPLRRPFCRRVHPACARRAQRRMWRRAWSAVRLGGRRRVPGARRRRCGALPPRRRIAVPREGDGEGASSSTNPNRVPDLSAHERIDVSSAPRASRRWSARGSCRRPPTPERPQPRSARRRAGPEPRRVHGPSEERARFIETAALVHDVAKIAASDSVLKQAGPLENSGWDDVRPPPRAGQRILAATALPELVPAVRVHMSAGTAPATRTGLMQRDPVRGPAAAVCDAYEAMTGERRFGLP